MKTIKLFSIFYVSLFTISAASAGMIVSNKKISISGAANQASVQDLKKWSEEAMDSTLAVCAEVLEIPQSYTCAFKSKLEMNNTLLRIGFFTGTADGYPKGSLISNHNTSLNKYKEMIGGHTMISDDINAFRLDSNASTDLKYRLNSQESDFYTSIIDKISASESRYVIVAFANDSSNYEVIVGHEINHANFYLLPTFKQAVLNFWNKSVNEIDKSEIRSILGKLYNAKDDNIIIDEFQAYLTQKEEQKNPLAKFIPKYKMNLMRVLNL